MPTSRVMNFNCDAGVIKGSETTLETEKGFLDKMSYVNMSRRQQGTFASRREAVYALFQAYLRQKRERREWDAAERCVVVHNFLIAWCTKSRRRTHDLLRGLKSTGIPGAKLDFM